MTTTMDLPMEEMPRPLLTKEQRKEEKKRRKMEKLSSKKDTNREETTTTNNDDEEEEKEKKLLRKKEKKEKKERKEKKRLKKLESRLKTPKDAITTTPAGNGNEDAMSTTSSTSTGQDTDIVMKNSVDFLTPSTSVPSTNGTSTPVSSIATSAAVQEYLKTHAITIKDPKTPSSGSSTLAYEPMLSFDALPCAKRGQMEAFASYKSPTPIQALSWPYLLAHRDMIGIAETGSGKTLAFAVPAIEHILNNNKNTNKKRGVKVVVVSPTRELAMQIVGPFDTVASAAGLKNSTVCIYGGVPKDSQRDALRKASVIVATPGRLMDFIEEGSADLSTVDYVVLDEADRMLDKGFEDAIKKILSSVKGISQRQTVMFTATWPQSVSQLAATFMKDPVRVNINTPADGELRANAKITQTVHVLTDPRSKESRLLSIIQQQQRKGKNDRILVFALYKKEAARIEQFLRAKGIRVGGIHGDLNQHVRTTTLEEFRTGRVPVLVGTDVAARGLDIPNVKLVLNVTFPLTIEDYVHRIGRTGRAGETGLAITFFTEHDKAHSGSLVNVLKGANQEVPAELLKFGTHVKKKQHSVYGAFFKESTGETAKKIKFDD